jgi:hypothetical protein
MTEIHDICKKTLVPRHGPWRRKSFNCEYLGEFEVKFETNLGHESGGLMDSFDEKPKVKNLTLLSL